MIRGRKYIFTIAAKKMEGAEGTAMAALLAGALVVVCVREKPNRFGGRINKCI